MALHRINESEAENQTQAFTALYDTGAFEIRVASFSRTPIVTPLGSVPAYGEPYCRKAAGYVIDLLDNYRKNPLVLYGDPTPCLFTLPGTCLY